jgi:Tfp pilus assembly protein PilZ
MDLHMPVMDGAACCRALRADPQLAHVPVVMLVNSGKESERQACLNAGCDDIITKPIDRRYFLQSANKWIYAVDRRDDRYPCQNTVIMSDGSGSFYGTSADISMNGVFVATRKPYSHGEKVKLNIILDYGRFDERPTSVVEADGRVAWSNIGSSRPKANLPEGLGFELQSVTDESRSALQNYIGGISARNNIPGLVAEINDNRNRY